MKFHWLVQRVTRTQKGKEVKDVDDGPLYVSIVTAGDVVATMRVGAGVGQCSTHPTFTGSDICVDPTAASESQLACGGDPHADRILCYDVGRTDEGIQITRREYSTPGGKPTLVKSGAVTEIPLPATARISYAADDEQENITE